MQRGLSSSGVSICTSVLVKQENGVVKDLIWEPSNATSSRPSSLLLLRFLAFLALLVKCTFFASIQRGNLSSGGIVDDDEAAAADAGRLRLHDVEHKLHHTHAYTSSLRPRTLVA